MASITIRNVPAEVVERLKAHAERHGRSMEQQVRELLRARYGGRSEVLLRVRSRWTKAEPPTPEEIADWRSQGRP